MPPAWRNARERDGRRRNKQEQKRGVCYARTSREPRPRLGGAGRRAREETLGIERLFFEQKLKSCCSAAVSAMAARNGAARWAFALTRRNFLDGLSSGRTWHGDSNIERPASPRPSHLTTLFLSCESKSRPRRARTSCDPPLFDMALSFA